MIITFYINKRKQQANIPTSWDGVTYRQFIELTDCMTDPAKILSVFTGIDVDTIKKARIEGLDTIIAMLSFLQKEAPAVIPKAILGYPVPADLGFETIAQFEDLKADLKDVDKLTLKEQLNKYPLYVATYAVQPYDWKAAEKLAPKFFDAPASEVLAIGNFTLAKLIGLRLGTRINARKVLTRWKKFKLVLIASPKLLALKFLSKLSWVNIPGIKKMKS